MGTASLIHRMITPSTPGQRLLLRLHAQRQREEDDGDDRSQGTALPCAGPSRIAPPAGESCCSPRLR